MTKAIVTPISTKKIQRLQNSWSIDDYKSLIDLFGGDERSIDPSEAEETLEMLIAENKVEDSAMEVLKYTLGDKLSSPDLKMVAEEMKDGKMWEDYLKIAHQAEIFKVNQLLYRAYEGKVPKGEAIILDLKVYSSDDNIISFLAQKDPAALLHIIKTGSGSDSKLIHQFGAKNYENSIRMAKYILWHIGVNKVSPNEIYLKLTSSSYWFEEFIKTGPFEVNFDINTSTSKNYG